MSRDLWVNEVLHCQGPLVTSDATHTQRMGLFIHGAKFLWVSPAGLVTYSGCSRAQSSQEYICIPRRRHCRRLHCGSCTCGYSLGPSGQVDMLKQVERMAEFWEQLQAERIPPISIHLLATNRIVVYTPHCSKLCTEIHIARWTSITVSIPDRYTDCGTGWLE